MSLRGSCLCGDIAFEIRGPIAPLAHCHCSMCRKVHGSAFASFGGADGKSLRFERGAATVKHYPSSTQAVRTFCGRCGSTIPWVSGERVFVPLGLLDDDPKLQGAMRHIFVGSKAPWHAILDDAPRFEAYPPGVGEALPTRRATDPAPGRVRGACLCGSVAYEIDAPIEGEIRRCHCSRCRKARAAAHASNLFVPAARFRWLRGEEGLASYKVPEAERFAQVFCPDCSSPQPRVDRARGVAVVPAGSLEDDPGVREGVHIFVASKAPWFEIHDAMPQHAEYPPA